MNIAVINITRILDESKRGRSLSERLKSKIEQWQAEITKVNESLTKIRSNFEKSPTTAPVDAVFKLRKDARLQEMELNNLQEKMRFEIESTREHFQMIMIEQIKPIVKKICVQKEIDATFTHPSPTLIYHNAKQDITKEVITKLDSE